MQAGLVLAQTTPDTQRTPDTERPGDTQHSTETKRSRAAQRQLEERRLPAILATQPRRSNGPLRRDNITDEESRGYAAAGKFPHLQIDDSCIERCWPRSLMHYWRRSGPRVGGVEAPPNGEGIQIDVTPCAGW